MIPELLSTVPNILIKNLEISKNVKQFFIILLILLITNGKAKASSDFDTFSWMVSSLSTLASLFNTCLEVPEDISFNSATTPLHISNAGNWVATGVQVTGGKLLEFDWSFTGITAFPRKYLVLYRIDPRFATPQIFIQTYDYAQQKYISDFGQFQNGQLLIYQKNPSIDWNERILSYTNYFNFVGRSGISVQAGDVVNITLISSASFFALGDFNSELSSPGSELSLIYTVSPIDDNKLIYFSADAWCNDTGTHNQKNPYCSNGFYANPSNIALELNGGINDIRFNQVLPSINSCPDSGDIDASILCFFDKGRGMEISIGDQVIKDTNVSFVHSNFLDKDLLYYESSSSGTLNISTNWEISGMFPNVNQQMISWLQYQSLDQLTSNLTSDNSNSDMQFLHFGRYILEIEIGNNDKPSGIGIEYTISASQPDSDFTGVNVSQNFKIDAPQDGYLWLRVTNNVTPQDAISQGTINVNYTNYIGSGVFTNIVYNKLVGPLRSQFNTLTQIIYEKLANNATLQRIAQLLLILYITIYGLLFLAGATKITVDDIVIRVIKISIITALFSEQSWNFFNNNLFEIYISGTDYIMTSIVNTTSSATNVFGFIDPVFDKYTNTRIWGLLLIQLLQLQNGLTFLAIMTAYSILLFFKAVLEVIVGYCLAFVGLAVMISLAPFFIVLMLFEQTKSIFDNWLSTLFSYMIQPTILLVFFLLIDQMIDTQLAGAVSKACWSCVIPLKIGLDLRHIGIPIDFSFPLPFLPCIPFYATNIATASTAETAFSYSETYLAVATSTILFYSYCLMSSGLAEYASAIASQLTATTPKKQNNSSSRPESAEKSVINDIKSITTEPIKSVLSAIRSKTVDKKDQATPGKDTKPRDYSNQISKGLRFNANEGAGLSKPSPLKPIESGRRELKLSEKDKTERQG